MINEQIKQDASIKQEGNAFVFGGTHPSQIGDILADIFILAPKRLSMGLVSKSVWLQAKELYNKNASKMFQCSSLELRGHSLGGGNALLTLIFLLRDNYPGNITLKTIGSIKPISRKVAKWIDAQTFIRSCKDIETSITWTVRHRDIVPFLGWWSKPTKTIVYEGDKRKHFLDFAGKEHVAY